MPFLPEPFDEAAEADENSESGRYIAEGQRIVDTALADLAQGQGISPEYMNLARYSAAEGGSQGEARRRAHLLLPSCAALWLLRY